MQGERIFNYSPMLATTKEQGMRLEAAGYIFYADMYYKFVGGEERLCLGTPYEKEQIPAFSFGQLIDLCGPTVAWKILLINSYYEETFIVFSIVDMVVFLIEHKDEILKKRRI